MNVFDSTVAAISTPFGKGGIAVIRISGDDAVKIAQKVFVPRNKKPLSECEKNVVFGDIYSEGKIIDTGIATVFYAPHSYTGENTVEISCHGGILLTKTVLESVLASGAQMAGPGEFTRRAFTNGKISLSAAEAVGLAIEAQTDEQLKLAAASSRGVLSKECGKIAEMLKSLISSVYAYIDFPDEDLTDVSTDEMIKKVSEIEDALFKLRSSYKSGHAIGEGIDTVIIGKPNVGKSTLLNLLCRDDVAIVTDIPGTTRDVISKNIPLGRVLIKISDTAGIHKTEDAVEKIGIERAVGTLMKAELVLAVFDNSKPFDDDDIALCKSLDGISAQKIAFINKCDLDKKFDKSKIESHFSDIVEISAKDGQSFEKIKDIIEGKYIAGEIDYDTVAVLSSARQNKAVITAHECVVRAKETLLSGLTQDIAGMDLESALSSVCEIDGREVSNDIVSDIFSKFCVGK